MKKSLFTLLVIMMLFSTQAGVLFAQSATPSVTPSTTPTPTSTSTSNSSSSDNSEQIQDLQNQISDYESKISDLQSQENTLSSAIGILDNQTKLTELKIENAQQQISDLGKDVDITKKRIGNLEVDLTTNTKALLGSMKEVYQVGQVSPWQILLASSNISNFFTHFAYLKAVEVYNQKQVFAAEQTKEDYATEKAILQSKQDEQIKLQGQLQDYNTQLDSQKQAKQTLLSQTQGSEANYQNLLSQAQAQLNSFSNFVQSQGGSSLLSGQTSCDDWGCYYNQRDSQWGGMLINGQSGYSLAEYGCLITSIAMVASHYGHRDILPSDIASSGGNNFAVGTALLSYGLSVKGVSINRSRIGSSSGSLPSTISDPVIVGISYDGGPLPDHFLVLTSGSGGNYMMNDPYTPNGHDIPFTSHYSLGSIVEVDSVSM